ncbi:hypothetical protein [Rhodococcus sp. CH91]|uniref:hypothetical protein n=1 Tax=Rhodococcus sp. CH91 TaxID=2910256 RepID=UPI001F4A3DBC|nr:hypothetical protein [Rhodococcus sp. CH91]
MKLRKITVATVALAAALTMSACSSDDGGNSAETTAETTTTTTETVAAVDYPPVPSAEELNAELARAFDLNVPASEKTDLVQGAEEDPELINKVAQAANDAGVQVNVVDVTDNENGTITAGVEMALAGSEQPSFGTVDFVAEDDNWKVSKDYACSIVINMAQLQSPACA